MPLQKRNGSNVKKYNERSFFERPGIMYSQIYFDTVSEFSSGPLKLLVSILKCLV